MGQGLGEASRAELLILIGQYWPEATTAHSSSEPKAAIGLAPAAMGVAWAAVATAGGGDEATEVAWTVGACAGGGGGVVCPRISARFALSNSMRCCGFSSCFHPGISCLFLTQSCRFFMMKVLWALLRQMATAPCAAGDHITLKGL